MTEQLQKNVDVQQREKPQEQETGEVIEGGEELRQTGREMARDVTTKDYTALGTNLNHGHDRDKHDVREALSVSDELVRRFFRFDPADHAAPHELLARKEEFIESEVEVFTDTADTDQSRWDTVERAAAPIPNEAHRELERIAEGEA
jgi:hypothetical protein